MKEITSKQTKKVQYVSDKEWDNIVERGWAGRFTMKVMPEKRLPKIELLKPEVSGQEAVKPEVIKPKQNKK